MHASVKERVFSFDMRKSASIEILTRIISRYVVFARIPLRWKMYTMVAKLFSVTIIPRGLPLQEDLIGSSKRQLRPDGSFHSKHLHLPESNNSTLLDSLLPVHLSFYSSYPFVYYSLQIFIFKFESHCKSDCQIQRTMNLISERGKERNPWIIC